MMSTISARAFVAPCVVPAPRRAVAVKASTQNGGEEYAKTMNGISGPFGYFDPLSLAAGTSPAQVKRYREAELTHGRVCMLAALGVLAGEGVQKNNLLLNSDGHIQGPAIMHFQQIAQGFWEPLAIAIGIFEAFRVGKGWAFPEGENFGTLKKEYQPGDMGFDPLGLCPTDKAEFNTLQTKEINNGRLAMIATAGFVAQELVNKVPIVENLKN